MSAVESGKEGACPNLTESSSWGNQQNFQPFPGEHTCTQGSVRFTQKEEMLAAPQTLGTSHPPVPNETDREGRVPSRPAEDREHCPVLQVTQAQGRVLTLASPGLTPIMTQLFNPWLLEPNPHGVTTVTTPTIGTRHRNNNTRFT